MNWFANINPAAQYEVCEFILMKRAIPHTGDHHHSLSAQSNVTVAGTNGFLYLQDTSVNLI